MGIFGLENAEGSVNLVALASMGKKKRSNSGLTDSGGSQTDVQMLLDHRAFGGGGFGFGTPVVSYAPRPMLQCVASLVIMLDAEERSMSG